MARSIFVTAALLASKVAAHGYLQTFQLDGVDHEGYDRWNDNRDPNHIGWSHTVPDEGPVLDISSPDMACRTGAEPAENYGQIAAGGDARFYWTSDDKVINPNGWAESHRGPVITYIAPCNGECTNVDKTSLKWTKIAEAGLVSGTANVNGVWATDKLREAGGWNDATIPSDLAAGKYVIRNELIALHRAHINEPEFYMQCGNIEVTGGGSNDLSGSGVVASQLYSRDDNIFGFDVYNGGSETTWSIPGPPLYSGAAAGGNVENKPEPVVVEEGGEEWVYEEDEECKAKKPKRVLKKKSKYFQA